MAHYDIELVRSIFTTGFTANDPSFNRRAMYIGPIDGGVREATIYDAMFGFGLIYAPSLAQRGPDGTVNFIVRVFESVDESGNMIDQYIVEHYAIHAHGSVSGLREQFLGTNIPTPNQVAGTREVYDPMASSYEASLRLLLDTTGGVTILPINTMVMDINLPGYLSAAQAHEAAGTMVIHVDEDNEAPHADALPQHDEMHLQDDLAAETPRDFLLTAFGVLVYEGNNERMREMAVRRSVVDSLGRIEDLGFSEGVRFFHSDSVDNFPDGEDLNSIIIQGNLDQSSLNRYWATSF